MAERSPIIVNGTAIKGVLFDLDGTLLDTETLSDRAMLVSFGSSISKETLEKIRSEHGDKIPWELKKKILGLRGSEWYPIVMEYAFENWDVYSPESFSMDISEQKDDTGLMVKEMPSRPPPPPLNIFWQKWEMALNELCKDVKACPGAYELVERLSKLGLPIAIATSSRHDSVNKKRVKHEEMFRHIPTIVTGDDPSVQNGKPHPDIYIEASKRIGVPPEQCLVFEDSITGVQAGKAAGCRVVAVPDPRMDKTDFVDLADMTLDSLCNFVFKDEEEQEVVERIDKEHEAAS